MKCSRCGHDLLEPRVFDALPGPDRKGWRRHKGGGLCGRCDWYLRHPRQRTPRGEMVPRAIILEEARMLVSDGETDIARMASRIGVTRDALTLALRRAERAGDEDAIFIRSRLPVRKAA